MISKLCVLYLTSYFTLLNPTVIVTESSAGIGVGYREADYRAGGNASRILFAPAHIIDRSIRPDFWDSYCTLDD